MKFEVNRLFESNFDRERFITEKSDFCSFYEKEDILGNGTTTYYKVTFTIFGTPLAVKTNFPDAKFIDDSTIDDLIDQKIKEQELAKV